jgi:7-cyano-7-deazaguanine synthase in queuosine biosynthesis
MKSLVNYLESLGYEVIEKCQSVNEDFATIFYAPGIISTISSFSFMAGYFSDGVFISSMYNETGSMYNKKEDVHCNECGDWYLKGYSLKHSQVDDYHETEKVIDFLKN